jgi:branched-chain amino acid aminotransferase
MPGSQDFAADPRNASALISLNGRHVTRDEATVSIFDGGFVVGDGIWEGLRLHRGTLLFLDAHLDRLYWGLRQIRLDIGLDPDALSRPRIRIRAMPLAARPSPSWLNTRCPTPVLPPAV